LNDPPNSHQLLLNLSLTADHKHIQSLFFLFSRV